MEILLGWRVVCGVFAHAALVVMQMLHPHPPDTHAWHHAPHVISQREQGTNRDGLQHAQAALPGNLDEMLGASRTIPHSTVPQRQ